MRISKSRFALAVIFLLILAACSPKKREGKNEVVVHELSDPDMLNPYNYQSAGARYIMDYIFQPLIAVDFQTLEMVGVLAKARPEIELIEEQNKMLMTFEIRPEAAWDNGEPVTAKDVEFSLKVMKNPKVNNQRLRPYYEFIDSIIFYPDNAKKFTLVAKDIYIGAEGAMADIPILPEYIYDKEGRMKPYTVSQLNREADRLMDDPAIGAFAEQFNSENFQREADYVLGSGAYTLDKWETGRRITLKRKEKWWGDEVQNGNAFLTANPEKIIHETINDFTTAIVAMKGEKIDVMRGVPSKDFIELKESDKFSRNYHAHSPMQFSYTGLGINMKLPKFEDVRVRRALAHLLDVEKIIENVQYGLAKRVTGPIHPSKELQYNDDIEPYDFDIEKAKQLLTEAGWNDSNGNGTIDKVIDGKLQEFTIAYTYNAGNEQRKATGLIFQEAARKAGIEVTVSPQEWSVYLENNKKHDFEVIYVAWISAPLPNDPKQLWHTESYNGGSNYVGFGNAETDRLIEEIRKTINDEKRAELNHKLQQILHDEVPYIFMFAPEERLAIHKRFDDAEPSVVRPGYWVPAFEAEGEEESK